MKSFNSTYLICNQLGRNEQKWFIMTEKSEKKIMKTYLMFIKKTVTL